MPSRKIFVYGSDKLQIYIQHGTNTQEMTRCNYNLTETGTGLLRQNHVNNPTENKIPLVGGTRQWGEMNSF